MAKIMNTTLTVYYNRKKHIKHLGLLCYQTAHNCIKYLFPCLDFILCTTTNKTRMWANAQHDGRPAKYRWRQLFNVKKFGWRPLLECRAATPPSPKNHWNLLGCLKLPNRSQLLVGWKFAILWGHVEDILLFNKIFPIVNTCLSCTDTAWQSCAMVLRWWFLCVLYFQPAACSTFQIAF